MGLTQTLFLAALASAIAAAALRGGRDERLAAGALLLAALVSPLAQASHFAGPELGLVLIDGSLFLVLLAITLVSRHFWPIWAAGFHLCGLAVHMAAWRMPGILPAAYAESLVIWSYPVLFAVLLGTLVEAREGVPQ
jgi:hypothetical protein